MLEIADVFVMQVGNQIEHRETKHCICIATSQNKYFIINTEHREIYDDFKISATDYDFLKGLDRYVSCSSIFQFMPDKIIRKVGKLNYPDMLKLINKVQNSEVLDDAEKSAILPELTDWQMDNS